MAGVTVRNKETGEEKQIAGFVERPAWRDPCMSHSLTGTDSKGKPVTGTQFSMVVTPGLDTKDEYELISKIQKAMTLAIGQCLCDAGRITQDQVM